MKKLSLHWKIIIGMFLGVAVGLIFSSINGDNIIITNWVKPFGTIFINSLKLIAIPLILASLIKGMPVGIGEPVFDKLHAELGKAMLSINAVKGFEYGSGFSCVEMKGSEHNDEINPDGTTSSNFSGGIQGGISNGMDIYFNVAFKPVATIMKDQKSIDKKGNTIDLKGKGRHDPCVVPRAVPIVESMAAMVILDQILINNSKKI